MRFFLLLVFLINLEILAYYNPANHEITRPFGFSSRQPPSTRSVKIIDFKVGLEAQQVCGYTDWTTASLTTPKHLLSKQYWAKIGTKIVDQAKKVILDISGALPGMLACNVSPSWCNVLNKNQLLAAFESQLTFDSCSMLEGIANTSSLQGMELTECIKKKTSTDQTITAGQAREACLVNPDDSDGATSKRDKVAKTSSYGRALFNMPEFLSDIFPAKFKNQSGDTIPLNTGGKVYSRRSEGLRLAKTLFPGLQIEGGYTTMVGGTFQPTIEDELAAEISELEKAIIEALKLMLLYRDKGFGPKDIITKTSTLWTNKTKWVQNKKPHPFFRATSDGSEPSFLISPEQVLMLAPLADRSKTNLMTTQMRQVIQRITQSVATIKVTDKLSDIYMRSLDVCKKSPKYQDALSQKNCDLILERTKSSMQIVHLKQENEEKARKAQKEVADLIDAIQRERAKNLNGPLIHKKSQNNSQLRMPWE